MFQSSIQLAEKYDYLAEKFKIGYEFLRRKDLAELPPGLIELNDEVTVRVQEYNTAAAESVRFETHDRNFDIQYVVSGEELFGLAPRNSLAVETPYNADKDITLYRDPPLYGSLLLNAGDFIVVGPEEAHKPRCMAGKLSFVKKIIVKVRV
jgi:YhcH/YjgK/YiaL family protein